MSLRVALTVMAILAISSAWRYNVALQEAYTWKSMLAPITMWFAWILLCSFWALTLLIVWSLPGG